MRSRAKYRMAQFGLVGEQLMSSPFAKDYECKPVTTSTGYNLALHEVYTPHESYTGLPQEIKEVVIAENETERVNHTKQGIVEKSNYDRKLSKAGFIDEPRARRLLRNHASE